VVERRFVPGYLLRIGLACPDVFGAALPTLLAELGRELPDIVTLHTAAPPGERAVWRTHDDVGGVERGGEGGPSGSAGGAAVQELTGEVLCEQLRAPLILSHPTQARAIAGLLAGLIGSEGLARAMDGADSGNIQRLASVANGHLNRNSGSGGVLAPTGRARAAVVPKSPTCNLAIAGHAHKVLLDLLVALRRGLRVKPPADTINARSFIRELRVGLDGLVDACIASPGTHPPSDCGGGGVVGGGGVRDGEEKGTGGAAAAAAAAATAVSNTSVEFRLLELVGDEGGTVTCATILSRILLRSGANAAASGGAAGAASSRARRIALWALLVRSFDAFATGALAGSVVATVEALGNADAADAAEVLEILAVLVRYDADDLDVGHRVAAVLGRMLLPLVGLCRKGGALVGEVAGKALELVDLLVRARQFGGKGAPTSQRVCIEMVRVPLPVVTPDS
jgi:hypothetical protein